MDRNQLINEYAATFNTVSAFIETNKKKLEFKKLIPKKSGQKVNGFIASIFKEYGYKDGLIVMDLFSAYLKASLDATSSSAKAFHAIYSESNSDIALGSALAASRVVSESCIKIHYITSVLLDIGIRYLLASFIEHARVFAAAGEDGTKQIADHKKFVNDAHNLLLKLKLPTNDQIDAFTKSDRELLADAMRHDVVTMASKAKVHIDGNFKKIDFDSDSEKTVYHYRVANGFVHMNPAYITADSKNRHFWLTIMVIPSMFINCLLMTKFMPTKKSEKLQKVLATYVYDYKVKNSHVQSNWRR